MGNKRLHVIAQSFLIKYQNGDKKCKSEIVKEIIGMIYEACKGGRGAFVKHDKKKNQWYEMDYAVAREKVGYVFRDLLADQYKSSSKSKVARRQRPTTVVLQRQDSGSSTQSSSTRPAASTYSSTRNIIMKGSVVSDDDESVTTSSAPCFRQSHQAMEPFFEVSDILIESAAFLEERFIRSASFEEFDASSRTVPESSPSSSSCSYTFHDVEDDVQFDYESLLRLPLL